MSWAVSWAVRLPSGGGCRSKSGIFLSKWHKKVADVSGIIWGLRPVSLYRRLPRPSEYGLSGRDVSPARSRPAANRIPEETPMPNQWFFAANGQQQGPYPELQFRDLIMSGTVRADTM